MSVRSASKIAAPYNLKNNNNRTNVGFGIASLA